MCNCCSIKIMYVFTMKDFIKLPKDIKMKLLPVQISSVYIDTVKGSKHFDSDSQDFTINDVYEDDDDFDGESITVSKEQLTVILSISQHELTKLLGPPLLVKR